MRVTVAIFAAMLVVPVMPALGQDVPPPASLGNPATAPLNPPLNNPDNLDPGPDAPQPLTGELVPLPGPPPEGPAADLKLPDCAPPNCGTPQIMAP